MGAMRHADTTLWYVQVITGFAMFFLASSHLYVVFVQPDNIGPYASSDRVWTGRFWILYVLLLISVHLHAGIGMYRLAMKWWPFKAASAALARKRLKARHVVCDCLFPVPGQRLTGHLYEDWLRARRPRGRTLCPRDRVQSPGE